MPTPQKEAIIQEMSKKFSSATSLFLTDFTGVDVNTVNELRKKFREAEVEYRVVKNTLANLSLGQAGIEELRGRLKGVNGYAISYDDPTQPIKVLEKFKKELDGKMPVKVAYFEGKLVESDRIADLAGLPSKSELIAQFATMINSPMTKLAGTLNGAMGKFLGVLNALKETKEQ